jgi:ABC-type multidrug transport system ATPase subunit
VLEAEDLTVARGRRTLLDGFAVRVRPGELVHVAGPNGCGKSSLLRVLAGVVEPRRGTVLRRARCVYAPEQAALPESLPSQRWLRVVGAGDAELPAPLRGRTGSLSRGQLQRVVLTGVLHGAEDRIVIVDEPWAGLDAAARDELSERLIALAADGSAVIFTDHGGVGDLTATRTLALEHRP